MPRATVDISETQTFELESVPGGTIVLRRMTYTEYLRRRDMGARMAMQVKGGGRRGRKRNQVDDDELEAVMELANAAITEFEFKTCIVDHNLTDDNDRPLDFRSAVVFNTLDPRVGEEIGQLIDEMNTFEPKNSEPGSGQLSS